MSHDDKLWEHSLLAIIYFRLNLFCYNIINYVYDNFFLLQVRYDLLDCNHSFFESVKKLISLMETGMVKGGEALVPHLFQFLVLLASDQSKLVTVPQVCQEC